MLNKQKRLKKYIANDFYKSSICGKNFIQNIQ